MCYQHAAGLLSTQESGKQLRCVPACAARSAADHILRGDADLMLAGAADATIIPSGIAGFIACKASLKFGSSLVRADAALLSLFLSVLPSLISNYLNLWPPQLPGLLHYMWAACLCRL